MSRPAGGARRAARTAAERPPTRTRTPSRRARRCTTSNVMPSPRRPPAGRPPDSEEHLMATTATRLLDNYIAGRWTPATAATDELDVTNPATGETLARVPLSGAADLDVAVRAARDALGPWREVSTIGRARKLFELRERLPARPQGPARAGGAAMGEKAGGARAQG